MRWEQLREIPEAKFKRLVGVSPATFEQMRQAAAASEPPSTHPKRGGKRGPKPSLSLEEQLLMLLMYYREYRSFAHIGASFAMSEAQSWRIITGLEARLIIWGGVALAAAVALERWLRRPRRGITSSKLRDREGAMGLLELAGAVALTPQSPAPQARGIAPGGGEFGGGGASGSF